MSTLSFTCPKCQRPHDRVKPEMAGYKVKCQCGHVFRLGAKTNRIPGVDKEHAHRKKMANDEAVPRHLPSGQVSIPAGNRDPNPFQLKRPAAISDNLPVAEFLDDAVPLDPIDMLIPDEMFGADGMFLAEPVLPSGQPLKEPFPVLPLEAFPLQSTLPQRPGSIQTATAEEKTAPRIDD